MKAVLLCDDFAFAAKATSSLRRVGDHAGVRVRWAVQCWPVNALTQSAMAERILIDSTDAHLVIIPGRRAHFVPPWLQEWLERWGASRRIPEAALAVFEEGPHSGFANEVSPALRLLGRKHGLSLITEEGAAGNEMARLFVRSLHDAEAATRIQRSSPPNMTGESFRGIGINE